MDASKLVGMNEEEAVRLAVGAGFKVSTVDSRLPAQMSEEHRMDRITITVASNGIVIAARIG